MCAGKGGRNTDEKRREENAASNGNSVSHGDSAGRGDLWHAAPG